jgi:hypothetical protein
MKLTKGKIAKLYNKRKQTLKKRVKPKRGESKSKTFRQNRKINLSRRSLKRFSYLGGRLPPSALERGLRVVDTGLSGANARLSDAEELSNRVPPVVPGALEAPAGIYAAREGLTMAQEALLANQPGSPEVNQMTPPDEQFTPINEPMTPTVIESELPPAVDQPMTPPDEQIAPVDQPMTPPDEQIAPVDQPMTPTFIESELPPAVDQPMNPTVIESELPPVVDQPMTPTEVLSSDEQKNKLTDAIKTIVDEIAKQVESNLTDGSPQENSFDALVGAVGKMGGKRRNTRRFKLVKNKTKRSAA